MKLITTPHSFERSRADAWIILCSTDAALLPASSHPLPRRLQRMINSWKKLSAFKAKPGEVTTFPVWETLPVKCIILVGIGDKSAHIPSALLRAGGATAKALKSLSLSNCATSIEPFHKICGDDLAGAVEAFACGFFDAVIAPSQKTSDRKPTEQQKRKTNWILTLTDVVSGEKQVRRCCQQIEAMLAVRSDVYPLANAPGNVATPAYIAKEAHRLARKYGLRCRVWTKRELIRNRCGGILAVGQGSNNDPVMIILEYEGNRKGRPVALLGKTITFDTGGISLKPGKSMEWMKYDKSGGMAVLATLLAAARLQVESPLVGILAVAENMPSGRATRPGDIIRTMSGTTVEIVNTDAEGRLVLADAISYAARLKPRAIVDVATLTGACITALGRLAAGLMSNDDQLAAALREAGERTGERLWPLPLWPEYDEDIKSEFADVKNVGGDGAGAIIGGAFLKKFTPQGVPWAHLDIAGTAWVEKPLTYRSVGTTLFGMRLLLRWLRTSGET